MTTYEPAPGCGVCATLAAAKDAIYENDLWHVRSADAPYGVPGWTMLMTRRHVGGPAHFDDREAAAFGPVLRHVSRTLEKVSGALRVYLAAMGESHPHFHAHLVPRTAVMPKDAKAWGVFDLQRAAQAGEIEVDFDKARATVEALREALANDPPPSF